VGVGALGVGVGGVDNAGKDGGVSVDADADASCVSPSALSPALSLARARCTSLAADAPAARGAIVGKRYGRCYRL
jgi:hypothetical protein